MTDQPDLCCTHGNEILGRLDRVLGLLDARSEARQPKTIDGPIQYAVTNGDGNQDAITAYGDGHAYHVAYHGLMKRIPAREFDWGQIDTYREELETALKETKSTGVTDDGRAYWI